MKRISPRSIGPPCRIGATSMRACRTRRLPIWNASFFSGRVARAEGEKCHRSARSLSAVLPEYPGVGGDRRDSRHGGRSVGDRSKERAGAQGRRFDHCGNGVSARSHAGDRQHCALFMDARIDFAELARSMSSRTTPQPQPGERENADPVGIASANYVPRLRRKLARFCAGLRPRLCPDGRSAAGKIATSKPAR